MYSSACDLTLRILVGDCAHALRIVIHLQVHVCDSVLTEDLAVAVLCLPLPLPLLPPPGELSLNPAHLFFPGLHPRSRGTGVSRVNQKLGVVTGSRSASSRVCSQIRNKPQICLAGENRGERHACDCAIEISEFMHVYAYAIITVRGGACPPPPNLPAPINH